MKVIQVQDLQAQDIQSINDHQLLFHGQLFQLGPKISKKLEKAVLEYCQISCKSGQACLLQDDGSHWVVWKRVKKLARQSTALLPSHQVNVSREHSLSPHFIDRCKQELANCIGPIAELVFQQTLAGLDMDTLKPQEFVTALSQNIPSSSLASRFHDHCQQASEAEVVASKVRSMKRSTQTSGYFSHSKGVHSPVSI
ncbi:hypothetical protein [Acaryochloris marina]|uniref:hypothetical protein n=1 Tax=Acaryochloris marina TaxID=155978 RepID=UPI001BB02EA3|nr:hypothetical protein [Acaryochloris marina]QUY43510.1 hypothetical protein I1H34_05065 [Acaryochloris marina S15]